MKFQKLLKAILIFILSLAIFGEGYLYGESRFAYYFRKNPPVVTILNKNSDKSSSEFSLFWQVWDIVSTDFLFGPTDPKKMLDGAINGVKNYSNIDKTSETSGSTPNAK